MYSPSHYTREEFYRQTNEMGRFFQRIGAFRYFLERDSWKAHIYFWHPAIWFYPLVCLIYLIFSVFKKRNGVAWYNESLMGFSIKQENKKINPGVSAQIID